MPTLTERATRKSEILDAAEQLMKHRGVESVSMEEIAQKVGISKGAIYLHFTNRADLIVTISERYGATLNARFARVLSQPLDGLGIMKKFGEIFIQFALRNPIYFPTLQHYQKASRETGGPVLPSVQRCQQQIEEAISYLTRAAQIGMQDGSINTRLDPRTLGLLIYSASRGVIEMSGRLTASHPGDALAGLAGDTDGEGREFDTGALMKSFMEILEHGVSAG